MNASAFLIAASASALARCLAVLAPGRMVELGAMLPLEVAFGAPGEVAFHVALDVLDAFGGGVFQDQVLKIYLVLDLLLRHACAIIAGIKLETRVYS